MGNNEMGQRERGEFDRNENYHKNICFTDKFVETFGGDAGYQTIIESGLVLYYFVILFDWSDGCRLLLSIMNT